MIQIREFVQQHQIDCAYNLNVHAFQLYESTDHLCSDLGPVFSSALVRPIAKLLGVDILDRSELARQLNSAQDSPIAAGVHTRATCDTVWAAKLTQGILQVALQSGKLTLATNCMVDAVIPNDSGELTITTTRGSVRCTHVVHATNAYCSQLLPEYHPMIRPVCT